MVIGGKSMKYKQGEKMIVEITEVKENSYVLNRIGEVEPMEAKIRRQAAEITRLLAENKELKEDKAVLNAKIDAYKLYGDQHEEEYNQTFNQGAETAWELARKIACQPINGGFKRSEFEEIFDEGYISDIFEKYTYPKAAAKVAEWEKEKEEIKVGDVLEGIYDSNIKCVATNLYPSNMAYLVFDDGTTGICNLDDFKKTSRHMDIDSFLKQIRGEQE